MSLNQNIIVLPIVIISISLLYSINLLKLDDVYANTDSLVADLTSEKSIPVYMISTRGSQNFPEIIQEYGYNDQYQFGDINQLKNQCPSEIAIFVHGWHNNEFKAKERLDRVKMSLENNSYNIPLIGFSWDSDKDWEPAKFIAKENGPKLAKFILDYMLGCMDEHNRDVNIRLISHSLGARVILSTLDFLHTNTIWKNNGFKIASVHLLGAAVDSNEVSKNSFNIGSNFQDTYGNAIQDEVIRFYNLHNSEDNIFQFVYPIFEDTALGKDGRQQDIEEIYKVTRPPYYDINIKYEIAAIPNADAIEDTHSVFCGLIICDTTTIRDWDDGLCLPYYYYYAFFQRILVKNCSIDIGDNHAGYVGYRSVDNTNVLENDGTINIVVNNWRNPLH